jgi:hypothetical protein
MTYAADNLIVGIHLSTKAMSLWVLDLPLPSATGEYAVNSRARRNAPQSPESFLAGRKSRQSFALWTIGWALAWLMMVKTK